MTTLAVISVNVHDMAAARRFYVDLLGFDVRSEESFPHYVELKGEGPLLLLQACERPARADYPDGACVLLDIAVDDVDAEFARLRAGGADVLHDEVRTCPVGRYFAVADPSGNVVEVMQFG